MLIPILFLLFVCLSPIFVAVWALYFLFNSFSSSYYKFLCFLKAVRISKVSINTVCFKPLICICRSILILFCVLLFLSGLWFVCIFLLLSSIRSFFMYFLFWIYFLDFLHFYFVQGCPIY